MNLETQLKKFGLTQKEAELYLAGLQLGQSTIQDLVNRSHLKRATVYDLIENLRNQGLMKIIYKGKRKI